jgi:hypothetical protein
VTCAVSEPRLAPHKLTGINQAKQKPSASWAFALLLGFVLKPATLSKVIAMRFFFRKKGKPLNLLLWSDTALHCAA